jgi:hypothetical protein
MTDGLETHSTLHYSRAHVHVPTGPKGPARMNSSDDSDSVKLAQSSEQLHHFKPDGSCSIADDKQTDRRTDLKNRTEVLS